MIDYRQGNQNSKKTKYTNQTQQKSYITSCLLRQTTTDIRKRKWSSWKVNYLAIPCYTLGLSALSQSAPSVVPYHGPDHAPHIISVFCPFSFSSVSYSSSNTYGRKMSTGCNHLLFQQYKIWLHIVINGFLRVGRWTAMRPWLRLSQKNSSRIIEWVEKRWIFREPFCLTSMSILKEVERHTHATGQEVFYRLHRQDTTRDSVIPSR